jgi:hypothetical protein
VEKSLPGGICTSRRKKTTVRGVWILSIKKASIALSSALLWSGRALFYNKIKGKTAFHFRKFRRGKAVWKQQKSSGY